MIGADEAQTIQAGIERLNSALAERDARELSSRIMAALKAAGVKIAAPDVADVIIRHVAMGAPSDPETAALDMAKKYPQIFVSPSEKGAGDAAALESAEQRAEALARMGITHFKHTPPTREQFVADAAAGAKPQSATPGQREAFLKSKGIL